MGIPVHAPGPMTVDQFYALKDDVQPDDERWELIGGELVVNASPTDLHGLIVTNIITVLSNRRREIDATWIVLPSTGVRASDRDRPEPDVLVVPHDKPLGSRDRNDPIVVFEILSRSTRRSDLGDKFKAYVTLPSLTHHIVIEQDLTHVRVFARAENFDVRAYNTKRDVIELPSLNASLRLADIYWGTGLLA